MTVLGLLGAVIILTGLIHLYLWKRLVRDTLRPGRKRRIGGLLMLTLALLIPATLAGTNAGVDWVAWPGFLWLAVMFYLLVLLVVLEVPMLIARLVLRRRSVAGQVRQPVRLGERAGHDGDATDAFTPVDAGALVEHTAARPALVGPPQSNSPVPGTTMAEPTGTTRPTGTTGTTRPIDAADRAGSTESTATESTAPDPGRRLLLARGAAIFTGLTAAGITGYGVRTALGPPQLDRVQIPLAKLPRRMDGLRIATVSDIHLGPLAGRSHTERIVAAINRLDADLVAVVGDLVDGTVAQLGDAAAPLRGLRSRYGSYFVTGNHEYYSGVEQWVVELDRLGLRVLQNERREIRARGGVLDLAGVNDPSGRGMGLAAGPDFDAALAGRDPSRPVVLLAHQPIQVHEAAKHGVDLQLSGHTHGGQMVPFNLLVGLQQPVVSGHATIDGTQIYVTNGAGFWGPPVRVGAPPQITLVELRSAS